VNKVNVKRSLLIGVAVVGIARYSVEPVCSEKKTKRIVRNERTTHDNTEGVIDAIVISATPGISEINQVLLDLRSVSLQGRFGPPPKKLGPAHLAKKSGNQIKR